MTDDVQYEVVVVLNVAVVVLPVAVADGRKARMQFPCPAVFSLINPKSMEWMYSMAHAQLMLFSELAMVWAVVDAFLVEMLHVHTVDHSLDQASRTASIRVMKRARN